MVAIENKSVGPACNKGLKTEQQGASLPAYLCQGLSASWHHQGSHKPLVSYSVVLYTYYSKHLMQMKCILSGHYAWSVVNFQFMLPSNARVCACMCVCTHTNGYTCLCTKAKKITSDLFHYSLSYLFP